MHQRELLARRWNQSVVVGRCSFSKSENLSFSHVQSDGDQRIKGELRGVFFLEQTSHLAGKVRS